jgi:hypothetical protein
MTDSPRVPVLAHGYYWVRAPHEDEPSVMLYDDQGWWSMGNEREWSDEQFLRFGYEAIDRIAPSGNHVTLFDHNERAELVHPERGMVVTSVEVLELGHDTGNTMLDVVLGCMSVLRRWHPVRSVPMRIYVPPRQNFWCAVRPILEEHGYTQQSPAKLKVTWRFATAEENS